MNKMNNLFISRKWRGGREDKGFGGKWTNESDIIGTVGLILFSSYLAWDLSYTVSSY